MTWCTACGGWSPGPSVVRFTDASVSLVQCPDASCASLVDPFVERDATLVALDLALHRVPAFRHVVCNRGVAGAGVEGGAGGVSVPRLALLAVVVDALTMAWATDEAAVAKHLTVAAAAWAASALCALAVALLAPGPVGARGGDPPRTADAVLRAVVVARIPAIAVFFVATCWDYPVEARWLFELYAFTALVAASRALPRSLGVGEALCTASLATLARATTVAWLPDALVRSGLVPARSVPFSELVEQRFF